MGVETLKRLQILISRFGVTPTSTWMQVTDVLYLAGEIIHASLGQRGGVVGLASLFIRHREKLLLAVGICCKVLWTLQDIQSLLPRLNGSHAIFKVKTSLVISTCSLWMQKEIRECVKALHLQESRLADSFRRMRALMMPYQKSCAKTNSSPDQNWGAKHHDHLHWKLNLLGIICMLLYSLPHLELVYADKSLR